MIQEIILTKTSTLKVFSPPTFDYAPVSASELTTINLLVPHLVILTVALGWFKNLY